jgi:hypothetical protein
MGPTENWGNPAIVGDPLKTGGPDKIWGAPGPQPHTGYGPALEKTEQLTANKDVNVQLILRSLKHNRSLER